MDIASRKCSPVLYQDSNGKRVPHISVLVNATPQYMEVMAYKSGCIISATFPDHQEILVVSSDDPVARTILAFPGESFDLGSVCTNDDNLLFLRRGKTNLRMLIAMVTGYVHLRTSIAFDGMGLSTIK